MNETKQTQVNQPNAKFRDLMIGDEFEWLGRTYMKMSMSHDAWARTMSGLRSGEYVTVKDDEPVYCDRPRFTEPEFPAPAVPYLTEEEIEELARQEPIEPEYGPASSDTKEPANE